MSIFGVAVHNVPDTSKAPRASYNIISHEMSERPLYRTVATPKQNVTQRPEPNMALVGKRVEGAMNMYRRYNAAACGGEDGCRDDRPTHFLELAHQYNRRANSSGTMRTAQRGSKVWQYYRNRDFSPERQLSTAYDTFISKEAASRCGSSCTNSRSATPRDGHRGGGGANPYSYLARPPTPKQQPISDLLASCATPRKPAVVRPRTGGRPNTARSSAVSKVSAASPPSLPHHRQHPAFAADAEKSVSPPRPSTARAPPSVRGTHGARIFTAATRNDPLVGTATPSSSFEPSMTAPKSHRASSARRQGAAAQRKPTPMGDGCILDDGSSTLMAIAQFEMRLRQRASSASGSAARSTSQQPVPAAEHASSFSHRKAGTQSSAPQQQAKSKVPRLQLQPQPQRAASARMDATPDELIYSCHSQSSP